MDKRTIIGIVLIILVTLLMPFYQKWIVGDKPPTQPQSPIQPADTLITARDTIQEQDRRKDDKKEPVISQQDTVTETTEPQVTLEDAPDAKQFTIENELTKIVWSTERGGNPIYWELKEYEDYRGGNVNLIDENALDLSFLNANGKQINLTDYNLYTDIRDGRQFILNNTKPELKFKFYLPVENGRIVKTIHFYKDKYSYDLEITFENLNDYIINRNYDIKWQNGLPTTEQNVDDDLSFSRVFTYMAEELEGVDASEDNYEEKSFNGRVDWVAVRTKYFLSAIVPSRPGETNGSTIGGIERKTNNIRKKVYDASIEMDYAAKQTVSDSFIVYLGPLDYYVLQDYEVELESMVMNKGWYERLFRPISTLIIIPSFEFLHRFIPNYGFVIILFSILIKLILHPLTKKSYQSMSEKQYLQPKMQEMREKYKNEPQRLNKEMMKLYKEHGVNPLGGCLPMLLQMPVLVALFTVFRSTIQLRGEPFILWINDLSRPDELFLGLNLPIIGDNLHVLPIFMGLTMIWQSKMTITDPKQKMMTYFMPVFLLFIFYTLPSGLNLYYAVFNLLSMFQTRAIKKKMHPDTNKPEQKPSSSKAVKGKKVQSRKK